MDAKQIKKQAQDENTPPKMLAELAKSKDKEIRRYIAGNPNTPVETLEKLGEEFPDAIIANPIFDLLLLENSESKFVLLSLARASTTSVDKLKELASCREEIIVKAVVKNSKTSASVLDNAYKKLRHRLPVKAFLENENTGDDTLARMIMRSGITKSDRRSILEHPNASEITINMIKLKEKRKNIPAHFLEQFASNENRNIRCQVIRYPSVSAKVLEKLSLDDRWIRKDVAAHPNTSIETLEKLARDEDCGVRAAVATSNNISPELAKLSSQDENHYIREEIARNTKAPIEIINNLVEDDEPKVRAAVAARKDISEKNAIILAHDISVAVIEILFTNSNIPAEITRLLDKYHEYNRFNTNNKRSKFYNFGYISKYFSELLEIVIPEEIAIKIAQGNNSRIQRLLATNKNISISTFNMLGVNLNFNICLGFIDNSNTPPEILNRLSENRNYCIRRGVAKHINTSIQTLELLKNDRHISVRERVAQNTKISSEIIEELANDSAALVRRAIASNPKTSATILDRLKSDSSLTVRRAVAENINTSINTLKELFNDEAPKVIDSAKENLNKRSL